MTDLSFFDYYAFGKTDYSKYILNLGKNKQIKSVIAKKRRKNGDLEAVGSIPTPATNDFYRLSVTDGLFFASVLRG